MKWKNIFLSFLAAIAIIYSCNKIALNKPPLGNLQETDLENKAGVEGLLIGAYSVLDGYGTTAELIDYGRGVSNWIFGSICGSEAYKGGNSLNDQGSTIAPIEEFEATAYNTFFEQKWTSLYDGIARANTVLRVMREAKDMSTGDTTEIRAEALFLRAFFHFEAKKMWNNIQMVDENVTYDAGNYQVANDTSWSFIENDLKYAVTHLPPIQPEAEAGRANKYAAEAFLAKAYMFEHKFTAADSLLQDIIYNGETPLGTPYSLEKNYDDNFHPLDKNKAESVFAVQMDVNDGSGGANGTIGDEITYPWPVGYSFFLPSQYLVNHFKTDEVTGLPDLDNFNDSAVKNDQGLTSSDSFTPYTGTLDPRLDWTVGRRGIPYLDWGIEPGFDWVEDQLNYGPYVPKKNVIYQSEQANYSDNSWSIKITANNTNLIRFADVLLWAAEAEVEIGNLETARGYVNQVRQRAADPSGWVYQYNINPNTGLQDASMGNSNIPAANYKIGSYTQPWTDQVFARKAVRYERMLELGMEGHRFFDLVRWGIAETEINAYLQKEMTLRNYLIGVTFTKNNEFFPIPQTEIDLSAGQNGIPKMKQNPGY